MASVHRRLLLPVLLVLVASASACGDSTPPAKPPSSGPAPSASASASPAALEPPDEPVPPLRTGAIAPVEIPGVRDLPVAARVVADGYEILAAELPAGPVAEWQGVADMAGMLTVVALDAQPGQPAPLSFVAPPVSQWEHPPTGRPALLWVRRPLSTAPATGDLFVAAETGGRSSPGVHLRFRTADTGARKSDPEVRFEWMRALGAHLSGRPPWARFASARLNALAEQDPALKKKKTPDHKPRPLPRVRITPTQPTHEELADLMETTTGETAVQEALQQNRVLFLQAAREKATVPLGDLKLPPIAHHPWQKMMVRLGAPPAEPMAANAPADFYYVRAANLPALFALLDQVDSWGTPAGNLLDERGEERDLAARYEAQLGLRRGPLTRALGPSVIGEVAVVGSDPYVKEGSDVTVMLRAKDRTLLGAALAATLGDLEQAHGKLTHETRDHGGVTVSVARSADGAVRQQRASAGDLELVSNSAAALDAVLDTVQGRHPRLADEPDFQFMLARDAAVHADVLAYMGDRFVAEVVGPRQKVLEARREIALGELMGPGFAALLYGVMQGKSPAKVEDLYASGLLGKDEMTHASGAPIAWQPGAAASSPWGTPAAMVPLLDLPAPAMVTPSEKASYERFARAYQNRWSAYIDPVALRVAFDDAAKTVTADLRELPLIDATDYNEVADFVGASRFHAAPIDRGARIVVGIGKDARMRRELSQNVHGFIHDFEFDWVGDWAAIGLADRGVLAKLLLSFDDKLGMPDPDADHRTRDDDFGALATLPLYAEIAVRSQVQAAIALSALHVMADRTIPGMFEWGEVGRHRDVPIVRIEMKGGVLGIGKETPFDVFYAVTQGALVVTLQRWLIERLIDEQLDGAGPTSRGETAGPDATQLSVEIGSRPGKGMWSCLEWLIEQKVVEAGAGKSRMTAEALFHGAPEIAGDATATRALGLAYLGAAPVTPDGASYTFTREGPRDPSRGTLYAPVWPVEPVAGSPVALVMDALARVRTQEAFDDEGKDDQGKTMRSLHARATFGLR
jgi:hypothetical protein